MKKKLVLMTSALMTISLLAGCGSEHVHNWGEAVYEWSADYTSCTATRVCKGDESHKETETANSTYVVVSEAKCEEDGKGKYSVTFENEAFAAQTKEVKIDALEHDYQFTEFVWADDYSAQAKYVCSRDASHVELHDATVTSQVTTEPGCETEGVRTYSASYDGHSDTKIAVISAKDHSWGEPTYVWSDDNLKCTATRVCANDSTHVEEEVATATISNITATCTEDGTSTYTATFEKEGFVAQAKENVPYKAFGHDYQFVEFVWTETLGNYTAQAKYVCSHDDSHIELHDAQVADSLVTPASCEDEGLRTWTATYGDHSETKEQTIEASGHNLTAHAAIGETCTEAGNVAYWTCSECNKYFLDAAGTQLTSAEAVVVPAHHTLTHHEAIAATRLEDGNIEYWICDVCEKYFSDGEGKNEIDAQSITIPALGTDKTYFKNKTYSGSDRYLRLNYLKVFEDYKANCIYSFNDFNYNDETKVLSFIITKIQVIRGTSPYNVGDTISFTYDAEKDVLMFGTVALSKSDS